jgi:HD superfamily phosphohydrolase
VFTERRKFFLKFYYLLFQIGAGYWVFPAASNNRYEHCIGTAHLARTLVRQLSRQSNPSVPSLTSSDLLCVEIAALCHDLGHGPFSHTFERFLAEAGVVEALERRPRHEETSVKMLRSEHGVL